MCDACQHPETDEWIRARLHPILDGASASEALQRSHWPRKPEFVAA